MANLLDEITSTILSNLPPKSLLRFKCVNKPWCGWISSPNFKFLNRQGVLIAELYSRSRPYVRFLNQQLIWEKLKHPHFRTRYSTDSGRFLDCCCDLLGSCHGLVLISINEHIVLWNPATRFHTKVLELDALAEDGYYTRGALCFDSSKNDYKAVMIMQHQTPDYGGEFVIVASLKAKQWRRLKFPYDISSVKDGITFHGRVHYRYWTGINNPDFCKNNNNQDDNGDREYRTDEWDRAFNGPNKVIYFDPISEKFHTFPIPEPKHDDQENVIVGLGVLNECLCMTRLKYDKGVEILVMTEYGVRESWKFLFIISNNLLEIHPSYGFANPFSMTEDGEVALIIDGLNCEVVVYNPKDDKMREVRLATTDSYNYISTIIYAKSLTLISPKEYYWSERRHKKFSSWRYYMSKRPRY